MENKEYSEWLYITEDNFLNNVEKLKKIITNSPEYLKLADCTQLIFDKKGKDKVHNRQTHTRCVASLALKLAKRFNLSEQEQGLAELIGLCHDLGHTALGHTGESRIDKILNSFDISAKDFNNAYAKQNNMPEILIEHKYEETTHAFEHHAHSRRVLRKILKDNKIVIESSILNDLEWGILCHSESRVKGEMVTKVLWTLARYADKFYAFTDVYDTIRSENYIPGDILYRIQKELDEEEKDKNKQENNDSQKAKYAKKNKYFSNDFKLEPDDFNKLSAILEVFDQGNAVSYFAKAYVEQARVVKENGHYYIDTETDVGRQMRVLQGVMRYMRDKGFIGKEEKLANAMVDEIVAYKIAHPKKGVTEQKDKVIDACLFVSMATDTELRDFYRLISRDKEWTDFFDEKVKTNREFETELDKEERSYIRENPDMILNYYFNTEINKVRDEDIKTQLYGELIEYRANPSLDARRKLIDKIELAQSGGDPFYIER